MLFNLGRTVITSNCLDYARTHNVDTYKMLSRHSSGDWGDLCPEDKKLNDIALKNNDGRIFGAYVIDGKKFYVITEWDRSYTTIMLAEDY